MKQTVEMKQAAFEELMRSNGFQYLGATASDGCFLYERTWHKTVQVAFYGEYESSYRITAFIRFGIPVIQLYKNGQALGARDYSSPKRAMNAIHEIIRCAGYEM